MRFRLTKPNRSGAKRRCAGFTLAEVLAALVFMAIVIPTAIQGLRVANLAGQVGLRKANAARIAERVLNELLITRQWQTGSTSGSVQDGVTQYRWTLRSEPWTPLNTFRMLTLEVTYPVQGQDYQVRLSTVVDPST